MTTISEPQTLGFQTEVKQLLQLMIHSLYSNKEIFLRELISNASDAADRLRFLALSEPNVLQNDPELCIFIAVDAEKHTLTIRDNGIGMSREEVIALLGTIAKSGTKEFLSNLTNEQAKDANLIGQFGVGFYSSFIVANKVTVMTRRADLPADQGVMWESAGEGEYTISSLHKDSRGTDIILHLRDDEHEFLDPWRLRTIVNKYSDHIGIPVKMLKQVEGDEKDEKTLPEYETVNRAQALWTLPKNKITDSEYQEFYKHISHDFQDPLCWSHNRVEGKQQYTSLLYIPSHAPFDMWNRDKPRGLKLYVQRVFIMDDAEQFLPLYMRFVKGVIDSSDLPLNISREILQGSKIVDTLRAGCVSKVLGLLENLVTEQAEQYQSFWNNFGQVLKEGVVEDFTNKERLTKLLRFASTHDDSSAQTVSFEQYVSRMKPEQNKIYYLTAESYAVAKNSPHLEIFRTKGIEVLLLTDRIDEWLSSHLHEFDGKSLQSITKGDLDLSEFEDEQSKAQHKEKEEQLGDLISRVKAVLGDAVKEVRFTHRLTDSPACVVADQNAMSLSLQRILQEAGQAVPEAKPIFEINPTHPMVLKLQQEKNEVRFNDWTHILFEQAVLSEGGKLKDAAQFVKRLNALLLTWMA